MKNKLTLIVGLLISSLAFSQTYSSDFLDGSVLVKLKKNVETIAILKENPDAIVKRESFKDFPELQKALSAYGLTEINRPVYYTGKEDLQKICRIKFSNFSKIDEVVEKLRGLDFVEYAEKFPCIWKLYNRPLSWLSNCNQRRRCCQSNQYSPIVKAGLESLQQWPGGRN